MPRNPEALQFAKTADRQYVCVTWFERDRQNVRLETPRGRVIFDLWDDDVTDAIDAQQRLVASEAQARKWLAAGARFVAVGADTMLLASGARELLGKYKTDPAAAAPADRSY